jgi:hypothetical protein
MNYKTSITSATSIGNAFKAVSTGINKWWGRVDNSNINKVGDTFTVFFEEDTEWVFEIIYYSPNKEIHWKCIKANHYITGLENIEQEWLNSEIIWNIKEVEGGVEVSFEHIGLTPKLNCYDACDAGWTHFITTSLKQYLDTGIGTPSIID